MLAATLSLTLVAPIVGIVLIVALYAVMCLVAEVRDVRRRNAAFAGLMIGLAIVPVTALAFVILGVRGPA